MLPTHTYYSVAPARYDSDKDVCVRGLRSSLKFFSFFFLRIFVAFKNNRSQTKLFGPFYFSISVNTKAQESFALWNVNVSINNHQST